MKKSNSDDEILSAISDRDTTGAPSPTAPPEGTSIAPTEPIVSPVERIGATSQETRTNAAATTEPIISPTERLATTPREPGTVTAAPVEPIVPPAERFGPETGAKAATRTKPIVSPAERHGVASQGMRVPTGSPVERLGTTSVTPAQEIRRLATPCHTSHELAVFLLPLGIYRLPMMYLQYRPEHDEMLAQQKRLQKMNLLPRIYH